MEVYILMGSNSRDGDSWVSGVFQTELEAEISKSKLYSMRDKTFTYFISKQYLRLKEVE